MTIRPVKEDSPLDLTRHDWRQALRQTRLETKKDRIGLISAGVAFYWFLAVFPALIAAVGVLDLVDAGQEVINSIERSARSALPGDAEEVIVDALKDAGKPREGASAVAAIVGIGLSLWSASAGMVALQSGLDIAYDVDEERKFVKKRLYALLLLLAVGLLGGGAGVLIVGGEPFGIWTIIRWTLGISVLILLVAVFYYLGPNREAPRWTWITPGGILATVGWLASSLGFSLYVSSFGPYAETYGSLAGVVVLVTWLYIIASVVLIGAELNAELERQSRN